VINHIEGGTFEQKVSTCTCRILRQ